MYLNFDVNYVSFFLLNSEMEQMKERFAKLLLGEDMSGGGKGVSSALALSNAITNHAGELIMSFYFMLPIKANNNVDRKI